MSFQATTKRALGPPIYTEPKLRLVHGLAVLIVLLAAVAAGGGLLLPGLYRDHPWVATANRGMDLFTLSVALPATLAALMASVRGRLKARLALAGLLGYVLYTYIGGAFAFAFNEFILIYIALFSLSLVTLGLLVSAIDPADLARRFDPRTPRRPVAGYLAAVAVLLALAELGQIIPFLTSGRLPEPLRITGGTTFFVYAMDLGLIAPLSLLAAVWLWRSSPWGEVLASVMLVKSATMGLALLVTSGYGWLTGGSVDGPGLIAGYALIAFGGLAMSAWFFPHCRG